MTCLPFCLAISTPKKKKNMYMIAQTAPINSEASDWVRLRQERHHPSLGAALQHEGNRTDSGFSEKLLREMGNRDHLQQKVLETGHTGWGTNP